MANRFFIIGNGFDLHFQLPTKVSDFVELLEKQRVSAGLYGSAKDIFYQYGVEWSEFEDSLAQLDIESLYEDTYQVPDYLSDYESDRDGGIIQMEELIGQLFRARNNALEEMIRIAESDIDDMVLECDPNIFNNSAIVSFNYTSVLEKLFNIENSTIYHIHGLFEAGDELIFGYKDTSKRMLETNYTINERLQNEKKKIKSDSKLSHSEKEKMIEEIDLEMQNIAMDYYLDEQRTIVNDFYDMNKKNFQYDELNDYLVRLNNIDEVVVIGHSMTSVDYEYMEQINRILSPQRWVISYYETKSDISCYSFCEKSYFMTIDEIFEYIEKEI
ncbi:AbiH family protein [Streptococcus suis]|uniref:AbiH family protein n=1 Tax=Streptococcus suis TaxID=1307 RepID=UPI000418214E|nr:AbiH family protein [Streptococcus suis]